MENKALQAEWCLLQNQFDSYEKHSLYIKLLSVIIVFGAVISDQLSFSMGLLLLVLWLQDAIWKTFQSRIELRLLQIEQAIIDKSGASGYQFNSEYLKSRLGVLSLIKEYFRQAVRPTVAFPYVVLILILLFQYAL